MTAPLATRAVITDPPGEPTTLTLYAAGGAVAFVHLDPATAVGLAGDLIEAARVRLGRGRAPDSSASHHARADTPPATPLAAETSTRLCDSKIDSAGHGR